MQGSAKQNFSAYSIFIFAACVVKAFDPEAADDWFQPDHSL